MQNLSNFCSTSVSTFTILQRKLTISETNLFQNFDPIDSEHIQLRNFVLEKQFVMLLFVRILEKHVLRFGLD